MVYATGREESLLEETCWAEFQKCTQNSCVFNPVESLPQDNLPKGAADVIKKRLPEYAILPRYTHWAVAIRIRNLQFELKKPTLNTA